MRRRTHILLLLTVLLAVPSLPVPAQIHKKVVRTAGFILDSLQRRFLTKVDTNYLGNYSRPWRLSVMHNASQFHSEWYSDDYSLHITTKMTNRVSIGIGYQGLAFNYNYRLGAKKNMELSIQAYGRKMGIEVKFHGSDKINLGIFTDDGESLDIDNIEGLELYSYLIDGYYVFNHRRFSYPAALAQSKIQKRSAGSVLVGLSLGIIGIDMTDATDGLTKSSAEGRLSLGVGYGYNWAFQGGKFLIHASFIPMLNLVDRDVVKEKGEDKYKKEDTDRYSFVNLFRLGMFYSITDRLYTGVLFSDNPVPKRDHGYFSIDNTFFARTTLTWRF